MSSPQLTSFDPTKKKKKKKVVIQDPTDDSVDKLAEKTEALSGTFANYSYDFLSSVWLMLLKKCLKIK